MATHPDWTGIVRHRKRAAAELAALEALDGVAGDALAVGDDADDDQPPEPGDEGSWLERQLDRLQAVRDRAAARVQRLGDKAKGALADVARGVERSAKRGLKAARATLPTGDSIGEKVKKGFKALLTWAAGMTATTILMNVAILYAAYRILSNEKVQGAARAYYRR